MSTDDITLRERIEQVSDVERSGDDLVSLLVPPDRGIEAVRREIEEDHAETEYLDEQASQPAQQALEAVRRTLRDYESIPGNGLAIYADGETDETYVFDDFPEPVREFVYVRSNEFETEPLSGIADPTADYGLLVVERGGAALGRFESGRVTDVETVDSDVMGKTRAGGQSDKRFERERERQKEEFFETVGERAERAFLEGGGEAGEGSEGAEAAGDAPEPTVDGLVVGGTTVTVDEFLDGEYLDHRLRDRVRGGTFAVEYASEQGLRQLAEKAEAELGAAAREDVRTAIDRFFAGLKADGGGGHGSGSETGGGAEGDAVADGNGESPPVVYGRDAVDEALEYDAVETALVSEALDAEAASEIEERTTEAGGECLVVPTDFERGEQFAAAFGGVGALLRFPVESAVEGESGS